MRILPGHKVLALNLPSKIAGMIGETAASVIEPENHPDIRPDAVVMAAGSIAELESLIRQFLKYVEKDTLFWIAYPKKSSGIKTDISRDVGWDALKNNGYLPVSQISVNQTWSALRFRHYSKISGGRNRTVKEVDERSGIVTIPEDFKTALEKAGLLTRFEKLPFPDKKEHIYEIVAVKRAATRERRIRKAIEILKNK